MSTGPTDKHDCSSDFTLPEWERNAEVLDGPFAVTTGEDIQTGGFVAHGPLDLVAQGKTRGEAVDALATTIIGTIEVGRHLLAKESKKAHAAKLALEGIARADKATVTIDVDEEDGEDIYVCEWCGCTGGEENLKHGADCASTVAAEALRLLEAP